LIPHGAPVASPYRADIMFTTTIKAVPKARRINNSRPFSKVGAPRF